MRDGQKEGASHLEPVGTSSEVRGKKVPQSPIEVGKAYSDTGTAAPGRQRAEPSKVREKGGRRKKKETAVYARSIGRRSPQHAVSCQGDSEHSRDRRTRQKACTGGRNSDRKEFDLNSATRVLILAPTRSG